jgi:alkylation response protein AidB-like acyl-CoA dehydrogenase
MRFALPEQAVELQTGVREVLRSACPPDVVRAGWTERPDALWKSLGDLGLLGLLVPEPDGMGLDDLVAVAALQEAGYAGVPGPLVETVAVAAPLLAAAGQLPPGLLEGTVTVAVQRGDVVPHGATADLVLQLHDRQARLLTDPEREPVATVDGSRAAARIRGEGALLDVSPEAVTLALRRGALGTAAVLVGLSRRMLDLTVAYVRDRHQFGVPVGSFQAVKHPLANALVDVEFAGPAVLRAAQSLLDDEPETHLHVAMAKALASDAAWAVGRSTLQAHGAMGYTVEYDLHLFAKRAWAMAADWGTAAEHRETVARALLDDERTRP